MIYLDHAAITPPLPCALIAYNKAITDYFGNPSSSHAVGQQAREALEDARRRIAECLDCKPIEIVFTSTATEASALALHGANWDGRHTDASPFEHHAVSENIYKSNCHIYPMIYCQMLINNEVGTFYGKPDIHSDYHWMCDATAAVGHIPVSFSNLGASYMVADGVKFGSVPGAAFLIVKTGAPIYPMIFGGGQERGMRAGTENVPAICAMAAALEWQCEHMEENSEHVARLWAEMFHLLTNSGLDCQFNVDTGPGARHTPYIMNVSFPGVEGSALALYLSNQGVMVSAGAACSNGKNEPSHVIMAMYNDEARARSAIRISFSHENTIDKVQIAAEKIAEAVKTLRGFSAEQQE